MTALERAVAMYTAAGVPADMAETYAREMVTFLRIAVRESARQEAQQPSEPTLSISIERNSHEPSTNPV